MLRSSRSRCIAAVLGSAACLVVYGQSTSAFSPVIVLRPLGSRWPATRRQQHAWQRTGCRRWSKADDQQEKKFSTADDETSKDDGDEELNSLKTNAGAAWLVNIILVVYLVYLYRRDPPEESPDALITLLSQELVDQSTALTTDKKLKQDLLDQAEALANIAQKSKEGQSTSREAVPLFDQLQALLTNRDVELEREKETTERNLNEVAKMPEVQREQFLAEPLQARITSSVSGLLAGFDVALAANFVSLAFIFSVRARSQAAEAERKGEKEPDQGSQLLLRFYGRWDTDPEWVLVKSVPLQGAGSTVIGAVRNAQGWMGSWSDRIITNLVARSARGMVRRRGWKRIVEQTMSEVGRTFYLGYLVETAADQALQRIRVDSKDKTVLEVPSNIILEKK